MESLSSDEEDVNNCPPVFPVDIITISDGKALLDVSKFSEILSAAQDVSEKGLKVACICVIGEQKSGKSFLANMILQNLIANGNGNWIGPVTKKQNLLEGFSWNGLNAEDTPGIKMMSRPFSLKKSDGERIILLLMDISAPSDDSHSRKLMETMACLLCPTIIVNQLNNIDVEFLNLHKKIFDRRQTPFSQRVVFTIRDYSPGSKKLLSYGWAKKENHNAYIKELLQSSNRHELLSLWDGIQHKEVFSFTSPGNPSIVDEDGYLTLQSTFIAQMKRFVTEILNGDDISHYQVPSMKTIIEHFQDAISWLNRNSDSRLSIENPLSIKEDVLSMNNESTRLENCKDTANLASAIENLNTDDVCKSLEAPGTMMLPVHEKNINIRRCRRNEDVQHGNVFYLTSHKAVVEESKDLLSNNLENVSKMSDSATTSEKLETHDYDRNTLEASETMKYFEPRDNQNVQQINTPDLTAQEALGKATVDLISFNDVSNINISKVENTTKFDFPKFEKIPTGGLQLDEENKLNQMESNAIEMREADKAKRNNEIRKEREEHLKNEATRGCTLPFLCIEFNLDTLQAGFAQPKDKFASLVDDRGNVVLENRISFLKDEFVVGTVSDEKSKEVLETLLLENLMDSSNESAENKKEIKFRGENLKIDLELFCSLIFTRLKESGEKQSKEKFSTVVISVPLWFASRHRQVIKATAIIAGFEEVFLINETSAAALGYFKSTGNNSSCLVAAAGRDSCNAAVYSYSDGTMKMISCFGDRHIHKEKFGLQKLTSFVSGFPPLGSVKGQEDNIYSTVIKELKCNKKVTNAVIVLTNASEIVNSISKEVKSKGIKRVTNSENQGGENNWILKGLFEYSRLLAQNIKSARESVCDLMQYKLTFTEDIEGHPKELIPKYSKYNFGKNTKVPVFKKISPKTLSFYEEASSLNRFHYGTAKFIVDKDDRVQIKATASQEGIYDVELSKKGSLIAIDSYALSNEERDRYSALLEKHFKKDPALEQLQKAKDVLKEIAEDMEQRFDQITVRAAMVRESIFQDIKDAIAIAQNPSVDLQTVELETKYLEIMREKKFLKI